MMNRMSGLPCFSAMINRYSRTHFRFYLRHGLDLALLPPQNATGNFVKVVQRLPVRIDLDELRSR